MKLSKQVCDVVKELEEIKESFPLKAVQKALTMENELTPICIEAVRQIAFDNDWRGEVFDEDSLFPLIALHLLGAWGREEGCALAYDAATTRYLYGNFWWDELELPNTFLIVMAETMVTRNFPLISIVLSNIEMDDMHKGMLVVEALEMAVAIGRISIDDVYSFSQNVLVDIVKDPQSTPWTLCCICSLFVELKVPGTKELCLQVAQKLELNPVEAESHYFTTEYVESTFDIESGQFDLSMLKEIAEQNNSRDTLLRGFPNGEYRNFLTYLEELDELAENPDIESEEWDDILKPHNMDWDDESDSIEEILEQSEKILGYSRKSETVIHQFPKVGRNELCSCGSGKKYKKCCLKK